MADDHRDGPYDMNREPSITIAGREIGSGRPALVVAELSANHGGQFDRARALVVAARHAGADAVKLQTYTPDTLTYDGDQPWFRVQGDNPWTGRSLHDLYGEAMTPWGWHAELAQFAASLGLMLFSTAYDPTSIDFLEGHDCPAYKIASFELVDLPLLSKVAATGKPVILSTGMATVDEIDVAVATLRQTGCRQLALLKCTSAYPAPAEQMNLRGIAALRERYGAPVGISDHSLDPQVPALAAALGAAIVEKHLTLARSGGGPDAAFSLEPDEFQAMVNSVRAAEAALGSGEIGPTAAEADCRALRKSLFAVADIQAGEPLTSDNIRSIRPGLGLAPKHLSEALGRRARGYIAAGTPLSWDLLE